MTESEYLQKKPDRTTPETVRYLKLRCQADGTRPDAKLMIVYEEAGAFRRVLARGLTGADLGQLIDATERLHDQQQGG